MAQMKATSAPPVNAAPLNSNANQVNAVYLILGSVTVRLIVQKVKMKRLNKVAEMIPVDLTLSRVAVVNALT